MQFKIYTASGLGSVYYGDNSVSPCKKAFLNGSTDNLPFSIELNTLQDVLELMQEVHNKLVMSEDTICIYDDYIE